MTEDIRWKQRFNNYTKAFNELSDEVALRESRKLSRLEEKGLIQSFEMAHELAWNVLKDYLEEVAGTKLLGSKDTTREAFKRGLIDDGEIWMDMIKSRNLTSHVYDEVIARKIAEEIYGRFHACFAAMHKRFLPLYEHS
ncbi:MAG: nucleotidyltransferase substrate binding protein [Pseudomonadota bacterium]|nr:nucleotidyltransferase substrate binding protein [Pseudomonadota bacterium]MDP1906493.1 nucleotidyltransferase substrate binding protein [Pseudomonadota bacterium]MDP2351939.1 nucleotidyltransferase substrate binding protein [Pseudomonadota bacterium]